MERSINRKELWVFVTVQDDTTDHASKQLLAAAQELCMEGEYDLCAVLIGEKKAAEELAGLGIQKVYFAEAKAEDALDPRYCAFALAEIAAEREPDIILFAANDLGSAVSASLGIKLHTGVIAHSIDLRIQKGNLICSIPAFGGQIMGDILIPDKRPQIATARVSGKVLQKSEIQGTVVDIAPAKFTDRRVCLEDIREIEREGVPLDAARLVVCAGGGIGGEENWNKVVALANMLNGAAASTRVVLDMDCGAAEDVMIGTSGKMIAPEVYIGFGISGAMHHTCGMKDSKVVINVNRDENCAFFKESDYGFVGDAGAVLDQLINMTNKSF